MEKQLVERFNALASKLGASEETCRSWASELISRYTERQRHYHTLSHIASMFACLALRHARLADVDAVSLAIFFHDWIYDPTRPDNETESIRVFEGFADETALSPQLRDKVKCYIERTITHTLPEEDERDPDLLLFLDADLEVLSRAPDEYMLYAQQIRREYAHHADGDYCRGRAKVLRAFLARERIYFSSAFKENERTARRNIEAEIARLEAEDLVERVK